MARWSRSERDEASLARLEAMRRRALEPAPPRPEKSDSELTVEDLEKQSAAFQAWQAGARGVPVLFGGTWVTKATVERLGIDLWDFPGVKVIGRG